MNEMRKLMESIQRLDEEAPTEGVGYVVHTSDSDGDYYDSKGNTSSDRLEKARIFLTPENAERTAQVKANFSDGTVTVKEVHIEVTNDVKQVGNRWVL